MDDDELEYTLLNKRDVLVYQIPPASSSAGHKADDWKKCIWRGRCRIAGKGQDLMIKMIDASSGQLFAQCSIPNGEYEKYVERVVDSSRYFVLKITNGQRHAFIGLGFEDRNDAFDFNCSLSDFKSTWVDREKEVQELPEVQAPSKDLSLKEGQKITINLKGMEGRPRRQQNTEAVGASFPGLLAPPPPSSSQSRRQQPSPQPPAAQQPVMQPAVAQQPPVAHPAAQQEDFFGDFEDFQSAPVAAAPAPRPAQGVAASVDGAPAPTAPGGLAAQFDQLSLGGAPSRPALSPQPVPSPQQAPLPAHHKAQPQAFQAAPADPFSGIGLLGDNSCHSSTSLGAMVTPSQQAMQLTSPQKGVPPQAAKARDPFDEFDIFK